MPVTIQHDPMLRQNLLYTSVARGRRRLALPAPALVEAILGGWADQRVMLERWSGSCREAAMRTDKRRAPAGRRDLLSASAWTSWPYYPIVIGVA